MENVKRNEDYLQVCIWEGTTLSEKEEIKPFENWFMTEFKVRVQFLEVIFTSPNSNDTSGETGGRSDIFFAIHKDDVDKFALPKMMIGARWIEDVLSNTNEYYKNPLYPERVMEYKCWDAEVTSEELEELVKGMSGKDIDNLEVSRSK